MKKGFKIVLKVLILVLVIMTGSLVYMAIPMKNTDEEALNSTEEVTVSLKENGLFFDGKSEETLLIYYPGGKVEYTAYSSLMKQIAERGIDCYVVKMPLNFALLGMDKAEDIIETTDYDHYYGGGHSLGGVAISMYISEHPEKFDGIIYTGSYSNKDISSLNLRVLSIRGSEDGLVTNEKEEEVKELLPESALYATIEGGNHAQFGTYGNQSGDNEATVTNEEQLNRTADLIAEFILGG